MTVEPRLPGDRLAEHPDYAPSAHGAPPVSAMLGTAVDSAVLLLEARRWWLAEYHVDHPMQAAELEAIDAAIAALERALECQGACRQSMGPA